MHYIALIDGSEGNYGASFPQLPGCVAMGDTYEQVISGAIEALREWVEETIAMGIEVPEAASIKTIREDEEVKVALAEGATIIAIPLIRSFGRKVKANLTLDSGVLAAIDATADRLSTSRSALIERMAEEHLKEYA